MRTYLTRRLAGVAALGSLALAAGACRDATSVPDLNNVPFANISGGLTPTTLQLLATGLLNNERANLGFRYQVFGQTLGLDIINLDPAESRFVTNLLGSRISSTNFIGAGSWTGFYSNIQTANTILASLGSKGLTDSLPAAQLTATRGFVQTIKALELYNVWALRGSNGVAFPTGIGATQAQGPILCQIPALTEIVALFDSGYTALASVPDTTSFPFTLPAGFSSNGNFTRAGGVAKLNRGLAGRAEVYLGILQDSTAAGATAYQTAINDLDQSFLTTTGDLNTGVYFTYSTAPNEQPNPLAVNTIVLNPAVGDSIQAGDLRASKIVTGPDVKLFGITSKYTSPLASVANQTGPIPLLRDAELLLLRAQAEIGLGQLDKATADINVVRTREGGLAPYATFGSKTDAINAVLYEKNYSLLLTGVQRLVDLRTYGRLGVDASGKNAYFTKIRSAQAFLSQLPIPQAERDARKGNFACTSS